MGTIKIEFDVPDFNKELEISVLIKKDGKVVSTLSPSNTNTEKPKLSEVKSDKKKIGGNMMNITI